VSSQDRCDTLFRDLLRAGYPCLSLHGGKDQSDRESTIVDYKANVCNILVATSGGGGACSVGVWSLGSGVIGVWGMFAGFVFARFVFA
jgi:hypothetical protein